MTFTLGVCERCRHRTSLFYCRSVDEYLCEQCVEQLADEANADDDFLKGATP